MNYRSIKLVLLALVFAATRVCMGDLSVGSTAEAIVPQFLFEKGPHGLVEVVTRIPDIVLDIRYATENNFTGKIVYSSARCFVRGSTLEKLVRVQAELKEMGLGLKIWDGFRTWDVQCKFWAICPIPGYVADPRKGSKHNKGAAVDITLIDAKTGQELKMPSGFDEFSEKAHRKYAAMEPGAAKNCKLLELVMEKHGFKGLPTEWWHFDDVDSAQFGFPEVTLEELIAG